MPCFHPLTAWRAPPWMIHKRSGEHKAIVFNDPCDSAFERLQLPCGQCIGCRLERSRQWALRCVHESSLYDNNCFLTLTYNDEHLPCNGSLNVEDFQLFMKRLRKSIAPDKVRFFQCGEYGETYGRPHHHCLLFGYEFEDKEIIGRTLDGNFVYRSPRLDNLWGKGFCSIGAVTFESAAYVARYVLKKVNGDQAEDHYQGRKPEYITMSRRPGIGADWFAQFETDCYPKDFITIRDGLKCHPPKYYDKLYERNHGENELAIIKEKRKSSFDPAPPIYSVEAKELLNRLLDREKHKQIVTKLLKRSLE